jgi:hypothetical protein
MEAGKDRVDGKRTYHRKAGEQEEQFYVADGQ